MRLDIQQYPSSNSLAVLVTDASMREEVLVRSELLRLCHINPGVDIQALDTNEFDLGRIVRLTFFDVRKALSCMQCLQQDTRFSVVVDFGGGTNRSVVIPKGYSLDTIYSKFSQFGEIEKIWLQNEEFVVDFFDSRTPARVVQELTRQILLSPN